MDDNTLVILDIDDTVTRSENQHQWSFVEAMKAHGITTIDSNWAAYKHHTDSYILKQNFDQNLDSLFDATWLKKFELDMDLLMSDQPRTLEIGGAKAALEVLIGHNIPFVYATGSLLLPAYRKLRDAQLPFTSNLVVGSNDHFSREEIVSEALNRAKRHYGKPSFDRILSFGDGLWDLNTARNLDLEFVGVGKKNEAQLRENGMQFHIDDWLNFNLKQF